MNSLMSMRIMWSSLSNRKPASALHSSVLPTPVGPRNRKQPSGRFGSRQAGARAADGVGHRGDGLVLADHALVQLVFHLQQLLALALHQLATPGCRWRATTTSAISSAPTIVRSSCGLPRSCALPVSLACASFSRFSSSGSLPYCSSATLLKSPLRLQLLDLRGACGRSLP